MALKEFCKAVAEHVNSSAYPIAAKLLSMDERIPKAAKRPKKDFGQPIMPCQGSALARRQGLSIAMLKEDFSLDCGLGPIVFGLVKPPKWWLEGNLVHGLLTKTREASVNLDKTMFRLETGKYSGVLFSPICKTDFVPDVVIIYCAPAQAAKLVEAARYEDGNPLTTQITARAVCSTSIVQAIQTGKCQISIPCGGDRANAFAGDNEIVFSTPLAKLKGITEGLETIARSSDPSDPILRTCLGIKSPYANRYRELRRYIEDEARSEHTPCH
jgi:uncharacterized protein (DUF169 family)